MNSRSRLSANRSTFVRAANARAARYGCEGVLNAADLPLEASACTYCGEPAFGWDHVVALGDGGPNTVANLTRSCLPCNRRKGGGKARRAAGVMARPAKHGRWPECGHHKDPRLPACRICAPVHRPADTCINGHPWTPENTGFDSRHPTWRYCRTCRNDWYRRKKARAA